HAVLEQVLEALVGVLGRAEARELPHRPEPPAVHARLRAARVREAAGETEIAQVAIHVRLGGRARVEGTEEVGDANAGIGVELAAAERRFLRGPRDVVSPPAGKLL